MEFLLVGGSLNKTVESSEGQEQANDHRSHNQANTKCYSHDERVLQRMTDGNISVIGHGSQEEGACLTAKL